MSSNVALADLGSNVMDLFRKVEKSLKESADTAWPDDLLVAESERFELWAANMGLFVAGHGSLDYRVREAERLAQTLRRFMQDLINSLDDGKASPIRCGEPRYSQQENSAPDVLQHQSRERKWVR